MEEAKGIGPGAEEGTKDGRVGGKEPDLVEGDDEKTFEDVGRDRGAKQK